MSEVGKLEPVWIQDAASVRQFKVEDRRFQLNSFVMRGATAFATAGLFSGGDPGVLDEAAGFILGEIGENLIDEPQAPEPRQVDIESFGDTILNYPNGMG